MKHRVTLFLFVLAIFVVILPSVAAQDTETGWDLTQDLKFTDLGIDVKYPTDWVYAASEKNGIFIAETKEDAALAADGDQTTVTTGTTINVIAIPTARLKLPEGVKLDDYVDYIVKAYDTTEKDKRLEAPIIGRRSITTLTEGSNQKGMIITAWVQGDTLVTMILTTPDYDTLVSDLTSWALFMKAITPIDALPLSETPLTLTTAKAEIYMPEGWVTPEGSYLTYELQSDVDNKTSEGAMIFAGEQSLSDLKLADDAKLADAVTAIAANVGATPTQQEDFILLGQPAIMFTGMDGTGKYVIITTALVNGTTVQVVLIAPTAEKFSSLIPTYLAVVQSLATVKEAS